MIREKVKKTINDWKVSIVIPSKNEERYISKCLDSIINCNFPKKRLKVFVCDGLSSDRTVEIINEYSSCYEYIELLINEDETTPYALNLGLKAGQADMKIILGAHSEIDTSFINSCIDVFVKNNEEKLMCVGGFLENVYENQTSKLIGLAMSSPFGVGNAYFRTGEKDRYTDTVAFGAYKSEIFDEIGYFDEELIRNQDDEFNYRILKNGFSIFLSKKIKSKYYVRASIRKLFLQYIQYGYWKVFVNKKHKKITSIRQLAPFLFVLFIFFGAFSSIFITPFLFIYLFIWVVYLIVGTVFFLRLSKEIKLIPKAICIFLILHLGYGMGYLNGVYRFLILNSNPSKKSQKLTR